VFLPTPDGPTIIKGLYFNGVGLNGWKYSLAKTKTSFYENNHHNCFSYRFVEEYGRQEIVENLSDFRMSLDILLVALDQLIL
jgi:hypothetical protein